MSQSSPQGSGMYVEGETGLQEPEVVDSLNETVFSDMTGQKHM